MVIKAININAVTEETDIIWEMVALSITNKRRSQIIAETL